MFNKLFKKKKIPTIKPKFKVGEHCIWNYEDVVDDYLLNKLVIINDYIIDNNIVKYIIIDTDTDIIYKWVNETELSKL